MRASGEPVRREGESARERVRHSAGRRDKQTERRKGCTELNGTHVTWRAPHVTCASRDVTLQESTGVCAVTVAAAAAVPYRIHASAALARLARQPRGGGAM